MNRAVVLFILNTLLMIVHLYLGLGGIVEGLWVFLVMVGQMLTSIMLTQAAVDGSRTRLGETRMGVLARVAQIAMMRGQRFIDIRSMVGILNDPATTRMWMEIEDAEMARREEEGRSEQ